MFSTTDLRTLMSNKLDELSTPPNLFANEILKLAELLSKLITYTVDEKIGDTEVIKIAKALEINNTLINTQLTTLNLPQNNISNIGAIVLAEALKTNKTLTTLNLQQNDIGDEGVFALAEALKTNNTLTTLNLQQNDIGNEGVNRLVHVLFRRENESLIDIDFKYNNKITADVFENLKDTIRMNRTLQKLELNNGRGFYYSLDLTIRQKILEERNKNK